MAASATSMEYVQKMFLAYFGRPVAPTGQEYYGQLVDEGNVAALQDDFWNSVESQGKFGALSTEGKVNAIFNQLFARDAAAAGLTYWTTEINAGRVSLPQAALTILNSAAADDLAVFNAKLEVANAFTAELDTTAEILAYQSNIDEARDLLVSIKSQAQADAAVADIQNIVADIVAGGSAEDQTFTLTNGTDVATANVFNAPMVFVPDGSDRILSLQDEDVLTGIAGRTDNTLNVTMGNRNADEGTTAITTPILNNIQNINIDWTGTTTTLDLRNADATQAVNVKRVTSDATAVTVDNIGTPAADFRVANTASDNVAVLFRFKQGVLTGDETLSLQLDDVLAASVTQNARGAGAGIEGFETVNLNAINGVDLGALSVNEMESLVITGSGALKIAALTPTAVVTTAEYDALGAPGIANPGAVGLLTLDASAFEGDLTLDITNSLGGFADPSNSGQTVHGTVTGGLGDDAFWTGAAVAATSATNRDVINGGEGANSLKTTGNVVGDASITNIQTLELRQQAGAQTVDFDAFDDAELTSVIMRDENSDGAAGTFLLNDVGAALAADGLVLQHSVTEGAVLANNAIVRVRLADASGTNDTVAIRVENERNTETQFNYTLNFDGQAAGVNAIENVTIVDADTEDNNVTLTAAQEHTGTVTLSGGRAGDDYTVLSTLNAGVIEASEQLSNLRLSVGDTVAPIATITQDIRLGEGDDILTFVNIDDFDTTDSISDAGGNDTVRAAFSDDADLTLTGIEDLHIIANENVALGMAGADVDNLVILANIAADGDADASPLTAEPFNVAGVTAADVITLNDTNLTELNFSADLDDDDDNTAAARAIAEAAARAADASWSGIGTSAAGDAAYRAADIDPTLLVDTLDDESPAAIFNGVTLANNAATALTVSINSDLDDVIFGATAYTLGQLTAHGITSMNIVVSDENVAQDLPGALTTINNIWSRTMTSLTVSAEEDVNLNTVSGAALNNSLTTFDASNVGGDLTATVISLGNNATVTLADGDNVFSALGSAGTGITITAGNGDNTITGSGQKDTITTGSGWDVVAGDRGDNIISTGAGNDTVTAKDGNDTFDVGTGIDAVTDNLATGIDATLATNTVSMSGGVTTLFIDVTGNGVGGLDVDQMLAVGNGSDLTLSWTGATLVTASAVLDGRLATVDSQVAGVVTGDANANLEIMTAAADVTFNGGNGNDVALVTDQTSASLTFNGGAGNDAAVGGVDSDIFTGGTGADKLVMQNTAAPDGVVDTVVIADGDSTAAGWDVVVGFQATVAAGGAAVVAGSATAGDDVLDLASATIAGVTAGVDGVDVGGIDSHAVAANGLVTFDNVNDVFTAAVAVGTGANQIALADALAYLATNLNGTSATVVFNYDSNGDGVLNAADSTFVFQDGAADTVVELVGTYTGVAAVGSVTAGLIEIV